MLGKHLIPRLAALDVETLTKGDAAWTQRFPAMGVNYTHPIRVLAGLQPWLIGEGVISVQSCAVVYSAKFTCKLSKTLSELADILDQCIDQKKIMVAWNAPYDIGCLIASGLEDRVRALQWLDAMLIYARRADRIKSRALKDVVAHFYPKFAGYERAVHFDTQPADRPADFMQALYRYNIQDSLMTLQITIDSIKKLLPFELNNLLIEAECLVDVGKRNLEGLRIDFNALDNLHKAYTTERTKAFSELETHLPDTHSGININSPVQVSSLIYESAPRGWGLPKTYGTSTAKETLSRLAIDDPRVAVLLRARNAVKREAKYVKATVNSLTYNRYVSGGVVVRPLASVSSTYTGRMTYASFLTTSKSSEKNRLQVGIALHQWRRTKEDRRIITTPFGYTLIELDFDGQEYRWMADLANDPIMLALCEPGQDGHCYMASKIVGRDYQEFMQNIDEEARRFGKVGNLSLQYRTSAKTVRTVALTNFGVDMDYTTADALHSIYPQAYPNVPIYWSVQCAKVRLPGSIYTVAGRSVNPHLLHTAYCSNVSSKKHLNLRWRCEQTAINFPIQGAGADQKYLALKVSKDILKPPDGYFYYDVHDGLFFIVKDKKVQHYALLLKRAFENLPYRAAWNYEPKPKFFVTVKTGKSWGDLEVLQCS